MKLPPEEVVSPGEVVGGYRVEKKLGSGGQGQVYLGWREGRAYALKFIHLGRVGEWGWRELLILMQHQWPNVVRLVSHVRWPEEAPEYLVLVMEYVPGRTAHRWAAEENPSARQAAKLVLKLSRALGRVHDAGVLHRDLKDDNVLVREADGEPVLVDFAAGAMPGMPRVTREALAPADLRFRSPESVAFFLRPGRQPGERYPYAPTDDLYALGVLFYALLTDVYPIDGDERLMLAEILSCQPLPPHEMNERVPRALSDVCMRLLEKAPEARLASTGALCAALEAVLKEAEGDAAWDVPLCLGWEEDVDALRPPRPGREPLPSWLDRWVRQKPRRGKRPVAVEPPAPPQPAPPPPVPPPPVEAVPVPASGPALASAELRRADVLAALGRTGAVLGVLVLVGLGAELLGRSGWFPPPTPPPSFASHPHLTPETSSEKVPAPAGGAGGEMASEKKPPEADRAAAPPRADTTPAAKKDAAVKTPRKTSSPDNKPWGNALRAACAGLTGQALQACVAAQQTVAPAYAAPPALECPAGAVPTMEDTLDIPMGDFVFAVFTFGEPRTMDVRQFATVRILDELGKLKGGTVLSGRLFFTADRVYGLFTEAKTHDGTTYPVCVELTNRQGVRGVERKDVGGPADSAVIFSSQGVRAVVRFEAVRVSNQAHP
ncbi:serine/threonine-protein kinase [Archangium sp.]|uniref:serine/threonine protein kinase n=1 Tax=Archangium sp. TaxID=1872627 RepID=UPI00286D2310|nr:serine/threonine-protein kinase [Archangium sp.]